MIIQRLLTIGSICLLCFVLTNCNIKGKDANGQNHVVTKRIKKPAYEEAEESLLQLKKEGVDTILFYKRTCISCCDFFNLFWIKDGKQFINNIHEAQSFTISRTIPMENDTVFTVLFKNYDSLKNTTVKENQHRVKDGTINAGATAHYCFTLIKIYLNADSITRAIKDDYFSKNLQFNSYDPEPPLSNDNYQENLNSKWNTLLMAIENKLALMSSVSQNEVDHLRTRKGY